MPAVSASGRWKTCARSARSCSASSIASSGDAGAGQPRRARLSFSARCASSSKPGSFPSAARTTSRP